ncbi:GHKL domain-containing protein [Marivirga sp. S37H4]|uniref:histidine kinase n=1 Tax=Marivirga aurantiaca TaxID=2802615 RepID=A0A934WYU0_9BACT|nr:sensor histidine kinase [Marivirga aurantiaca]MBK6265679.1 GHKL domain-containing protein [Marivirga aurantiaca]
MKYIFKLGFLFGLLFYSSAFTKATSSQEPIIQLNQGKAHERIGEDLMILIDETNQLTFDQIQSANYQEKFTRSKDEVPSLGLKNVTVWLKINIELLDSINTPYVLEIAFPTLDSICFFSQIFGSSEWMRMFSGDRIPFADRIIDHKNFVFPLHLNYGNKTTVYFKIRNKGSIILPLKIMPKQDLLAAGLKEEIVYGIFYGIMIVMFLYNLFLAFAARSLSYIFYVGIIAGNLLTLSALNGHAFQYVWYDNPWWANHVIVFGIGLWILSGNLFAVRFLESKKYSIAYHRIFQGMQLLGLLIILSAFVVDYKISLLIANYILSVNCVLLFISGIFFWVKNVKVARIFTLAWVMYLMGVLLYTLRNLGYLPVNFITTHVLELGAVSEVILLSISLGYKYRLLEVDKKKAQKNVLDIMTRSQELIQNQNEELELRIEERTLELKQKQDEVLQQNEELNAKNDKLIEAQSIIEQQNIMLRKYNDDLEHQVTTRTDDLQQSNQELAQNVQQLEQYAFMTAHNLRAPVARLLGLTNLLELNPDTEKVEWLMILSKIKDESYSLDAVIKDMNSIIELRKGSEIEIEWVNIEEKVNQVKRILKNTILVNGVKIQLDTRAFSEFKCNPTYTESIFYNLISNAIKYRAPGENSFIHIITEKTEDQFIIHIKDNGVGINLQKHGAQLFGMYKRFHTHVEGKGLGLFLVKSQMDILNGEIKIESEPGLGTTFSLFFPARF